MQLKEPLIAQILPPSSFIPAQAGTSSILAALRLLTPPETPAGTQAARVLPPTPQTPAGTQPVLLSSGQLASLEISPLLRQGSAEQAPLATPLPRSSPPLLPTSLPAGSMLVVNIPTLTGPTQVLQLHTGQPQNLPVPQTQGVTPVAVQTPQGVVQLANVAAGTVLKGTITGQVLSGPNLGQAILTITTPGPLAGQQVALAVPPAANGTPAGLTLVTGTQLTLQVGTGGTATLLETLLPPSAARATTLTSLGGGWESLQQSLSLLQAQNPVAAAAARANLPLLASFLPGFMRLMEAAQDKDPATLLGKDAAALLRGVGSSLSPDLAQLQTLMQRPEEGGWRGVIFPYLENPDANPQQGKFFWRREKEDDPRAARGTRFVAELNLSNLGAVQVDGLVTYPEVWMKIRLQQPQDADFASGLQQLVASLLEGLQLKGGVSVEITPTFPLDPTQEILAQGENPMGVGA